MTSGPRIGRLVFDQVRYSRLLRIADNRNWSKKTYNNVISVLKRAFDFGYRDRPLYENPARHLRCARIRKADRPKVDPFCMQDAELLIATLHRDWGEIQGNCDEFRFFTGLRPSEQIALAISDIVLVHGIVSINKARVYGVDRYKTKTGDDRRVQLCPRALAVLKRHLQLRARMAAAGKIHHDYVFFLDSGQRIENLGVAQVRWRRTLRSLKLRYRRPYTARHSSVSWNLMVGKNILWVAKQHGHSTVTMLRTYAAWVDGALDTDVEAIKRSMYLMEDGKGSTARTTESCRGGQRPRSPDQGSSIHGNLAVNLPVEDLIYVPSLHAAAVLNGLAPDLCNCFDEENLGSGNWLGWQDSNLRMAGSKRDSDQHNQQVADSIHPAGPLDSLRFPIAATKPATSDRETVVVLGPARGTTNYLLLSVNLKAPYGTLSRYTDSAAGASARRPERSKGVADSGTLSHHSRKLTGAPNAPALAPTRPSL